MSDYDQGFLAGQESLDRDLDAFGDEREAAEAKLAEVRADSALRSQTIADLRAKLAEVEKGLDAALEQVEDERARVMGERDDWRRDRDGEKRRADALKSSMDRARELAEELATQHPIPAQRELARLLSGDEKRPNPAHPDWFPPDGTGKAE